MWECEIVENIPSFFDPIDGVGAFQVVSMQANDNDAGPLMTSVNLEDLLTQQLFNIGIRANRPEFSKYADERGIETVACEVRHDGRFWFLALKKLEEPELPSRIVLAMYNSDATPDEGTARIIGHIVSSIRFE